jgi:hypothetical protein
MYFDIIAIPPVCRATKLVVREEKALKLAWILKGGNKHTANIATAVGAKNASPNCFSSSHKAIPSSTGTAHSSWTLVRP